MGAVLVEGTPAVPKVVGMVAGLKTGKFLAGQRKLCRAGGHEPALLQIR